MSNQIILISGKQGSGKSSLAECLEEMVNARGREYIADQFSFAAPIYDMHNACLNVLKHAKIAVPKKDGRLLQLLGTEWGRKIYGDDIWVNIVKNEIGNFFTAMEDFSHKVAVISDCRFKNELYGFNNTIRVRLECDEETRKKRILNTPGQNWREDQTHPSEIDLDDIPKRKWDVIVDTGALGKKDTSEEVFRVLKNKWELTNANS